MSEYFPTWRQWLRVVGRLIVFVSGGIAALAGLLVRGRYEYRIVEYAESIVLVGLVLATPVFFCLATFGQAGDRWTVRYLLAWLGYIIALCVGGFIASVT
jgi:hypothetical protein